MSDDEEEKTNAFLTTKVKKGLSVTGKGVVGVSVPAIIAALIAMLPGIYKDIKDQRKEQAAAFKTLGPAVLDLQEEANEFSIWADSVVFQHEKGQRAIVRLKKANWKLEQRLYQIELALDRRNIHIPEAPPDPEEDDAIYSEMVSLIEGEEFIAPPPKAKPRRHIPENISAARAYQEQRVEDDCLPDDPLCGMLE